MDFKSVFGPVNVTLNEENFTEVGVSGHAIDKHSIANPIAVGQYIAETLPNHFLNPYTSRHELYSCTSYLPSALRSGFKAPFRKTVVDINPFDNRIEIATQYPLNKKEFKKGRNI